MTRGTRVKAPRHLGFQGVLASRGFATLAAGGRAVDVYLRRPCRGPLLLPYFIKDGVAKQFFIVTVTGQRPVTVTNLGSRGFISWPPEACFLVILTIEDSTFNAHFNHRRHRPLAPKAGSIHNPSYPFRSKWMRSMRNAAERMESLSLNSRSRSTLT